MEGETNILWTAGTAGRKAQIEYCRCTTIGRGNKYNID